MKLSVRIAFTAAAMLIVAGAAVFIMAKHAAAPGEAAMTLYVVAECPNCAEVERYIEANGVRARIMLAEKEAHYNARNAAELAARARACGINPARIVVPLLFTGSSCLVGSADIIDFFAKRIAQ